MSELVPNPLVKRVAEATNDIVTPANFVSAVGLGLSIYGATHIHETSGVVQFGAGRALDGVDGFVARRTYLGSIGAKVDAVSDKIAMAAVLGEAYHQKASPAAILGIVAVANVVNAFSNVYMEAKGAEPKTSKLGKYGIATQSYGALGLLLLGNSTGNGGIEAAGFAAFAVSTPVAAKASFDYTREAFRVRNKAKQTNVVNLKDFNRRKG